MSADTYIIGADYGGTTRAVVAMLVDNGGRVLRLITADEFYLEIPDATADSTAIVEDCGRLIERTDRYLAASIINRPRDFDLSVKERVPPEPWLGYAVRVWLRRRAVCQVYVNNWHTNRRNPLMPRGRVRRWRSLKEKRQAWGLA